MASVPRCHLNRSDPPEFEDEEFQQKKARAGHAGLDSNPLLARCGGEFRPACGLISRAAAQGARIICTPELFRSQYFCQSENHDYFKLAETIPGPSTEALGKLARRHRVVIIASLFEKRAAGVYHNTAAIIGPDGKLLGRYRKMHIPDDPLYYEKFYFTPGDLGFIAWPTPPGKNRRLHLLGPMVSGSRPG